MYRMAAAEGSLYDEDFYAWTQEQAELLRRLSAPAQTSSTSNIIAEEIEDLGRSELHAAQLALRAHHRALSEARIFRARGAGRSLARRDRRMAHPAGTEADAQHHGEA